MKALSPLLSVACLLSGAISAPTLAGTVRTQERWTCIRSDGQDTIRATVTATRAQAHLETLGDFPLTSLQGFEGGLTRELRAEDHDRLDQITYRLVLVPNNQADVFEINSSAPYGSGKAILFSEGFIDCVGDFSDVDQYDCHVDFTNDAR